jgi:dinuclear metal center YbgI/SA1388 family protein
MAVTVQDIIDTLDVEVPFSLAESWDNVGLLVGDPGQQVTGILAGLDATSELIEEALARNCNTIITHHPVIFKPLATINTGTPEGRLLQKALARNIAIIGFHTNFDSAEHGVSDYLGLQLGITEMTPLLREHEGDGKTGIGRIGSYQEALEIDEFLRRTLTALHLKGVQVAGPLPEKVRSVAICGGSGSDLAPLAFASGADIYLSAEIKHSTAIWARENNFCIIDGTHYGTEKPAICLLVKKLREISGANGWSIGVVQTEQEQPPFIYRENSIRDE